MDPRDRERLDTGRGRVPVRHRALATMATVAALAAGMLALVTAASAPGPAGAAGAAQDWPTFLQSTSRTAATTDPNLTVANAPQLTLKWTTTTGGPIAAATSIVGTTAYVGSWDGYEYAVNTATGAVLWKTFLGTTTNAACPPSPIGVTSTAAVVSVAGINGGNPVVYVGGGDAYWYAVDAATGTVLWKLFVGDTSQTGAHFNWSSPLIVNGAAYVGVASNCDNPLVQGGLLKVDLASQQVVAQHWFVPAGQLGGSVWTAPVYDAATNTVFVSNGNLNDYTQTESQSIVALDATALTTKSSWQLPFAAAVTDSDWSTSPTLTTDANGDQLLSVGNKNGVVYTLNRNNLAAGPVWQHQVAIGGDCLTCGEGTVSAGSFANNVLYYAGGHNVLNGHGANGSIRALDSATGNELWVHQTDQPIIGSAALVNGVIAEVEGSTFEVLDASSGALLYSYLLPAPSYGGVTFAQGLFFVGGYDGKLYAFGLAAAPKPPPADPNCPPGFTCQDIKKPPAGSEQSASGVLTVTGGGAGIKGTGDQFRLVSKAVTGDSQASVRLVAQANPGNSNPAQAGLIVRQSLDPSSPYYAILAYPNDTSLSPPGPDLQVWYRSAFGKNPTQLAKYPVTLPVSVMVQRQGNSFSAGISSDGTTYTLIPGSSTGLDLPATTLQGLAVDSGSGSNTSTASFANLAVGGPPATAMAPPAPADPCPSPWTCADVGNPKPIGDTTASGASLTLAGTGAGFGGATDSAHFVYQPVTGNQSISAQVVTQAGAPVKSQAGLMMRANASPSAPMYSVYLNPGGSATVQWRAYDGIKWTHPLPLTGTTSPAYLQIARYQDTRFTPPVTFFSAATSPDGITWNPVLGSTVAIGMGSGSYLAGVAATSASATATAPAVFNSVTLTGVSVPPPGICPSGYACADVGTGIPDGNQLFLNNTWTVQAAGNLYGVYDTFRFADAPFPADPANSVNGDGTIAAHVVSQTGGGPFMRSGVMIRSGTDPQAPYYGVFVTPSRGVAVQWRSTKAAQTAQVILPASPATAAPLFVLASRYTDTAHGVVYYSASTSPDGKTWTLVPGSTVALNLPGPLVAGIASESNSSNNQAVATFDSVGQLGGSQPPPNTCPSAWSCTDIGGALPAGQDQLSNGTWSEIGGGGDIWGTADAFHLVSQALTADGTVTAHLTAQQATSPWAKAGPMVRATTDAGSMYYAAFVTPANGISIQWRSAQGATTSQLLTPGTVPAYLMIGRYTTSGASPQTSYTAYTSPDGSTWTPVAGSTVPLAMSGPLLAGFAVTSHSQGTGSSVTLDSVAVAAGELAPPGVCPVAWQCGDVGTAKPAGGQNLAGGVWTLQGGGGDIWGTADAFHYVWQSLAADGSIGARMVSQTNTSAWAKAGPMLRASTDPGAPYYAVFVTPANGIAVQWRTAQGGSTSQVTTAGTVGTYLQVSRSGTTFTASTSPDGVTWTPIPKSTVSLANLSGPILTGLAATSHNTGALSTVVVDSVVTSP